MLTHCIVTGLVSYYRDIWQHCYATPYCSAAQVKHPEAASVLCKMTWISTLITNTTNHRHSWEGGGSPTYCGVKNTFNVIAVIKY